MFSALFFTISFFFYEIQSSGIVNTAANVRIIGYPQTQARTKAAKE